MGRRLDTGAFIDWCERQVDQSRSPTARYVGKHNNEHRCRIREEGTPEDIVLVKGKDVDTIRFEKGDKVKQYHMHRRDVELHRKTMIIRDKKTGDRINSAGTGTKKRRGPFPLTSPFQE